jgi:hypothetical protein
VTARGAALAALCVAAAATGCGSGGPHLSKAAYLRRGEAICRDYARQLRALGTPDQLSQIAPYIASALPLLARTVDRLGRLRPPPDYQGSFDAYLKAIRATRQRAFALRDAAARADAAEVQSLLSDAARSSGQTSSLARRAGLSACATG